jgi:hypothetical protein
VRNRANRPGTKVVAGRFMPAAAGSGDAGGLVDEPGAVLTPGPGGARSATVPAIGTAGRWRSPRNGQRGVGHLRFSPQCLGRAAERARMTTKRRSVSLSS